MKKLLSILFCCSLVVNITLAQGSPGQGDIQNPLSLHINHAFIAYNGLVYDPSYGVITVPPATDPFDPQVALSAHAVNSLDSFTGTIYKVTFDNTQVVKYYYYVGSEAK